MTAQPTYIVTGGAGFVGSNLAAELLKRRPSAFVVIIDNFRSGSFANITEACRRRAGAPFSGDVIAGSVHALNWPRLFERFQPAALFHLAAITDTTVADESLMIEQNTHGFAGLMSLCAEARTPIVYASSAATYGTPPHAARREAFPESAAGSPSNVYGFSKWLMEQDHARFARLHPKAQAVGLRYFNVFGPGESRKGAMASMPFQLATQILSGKAPRLFRDGSQARDQVSVDDVVDCTLHASGLFGGSPKPGVYNLGSGTLTSFNDIVGAIREALDLRPGTLDTEYFDMPAHVRAFYQDFTLADMKLAANGLGWKPTRTPRAAIGEYARWLRSERGGQGARV